MTEIPSLPNGIQRKLDLQWQNLIEASGFTGDHLTWHESKHRRRQAARPPFSLAPPPPGDRVTYYGKQGEPTPYSKWREQQEEAWEARQQDPAVIDSIGVPETIALSKKRFAQITKDYFAMWSREDTPRTDRYADWLQQIRRSVVSEVVKLWGSQSAWHSDWFERACRATLEDDLGALITQETARARTLEIQRLEGGGVIQVSDSTARGLHHILSSGPREPAFRRSRVRIHPAKSRDERGSERTRLTSDQTATRDKDAIAERAALRRAFVMPILKKLRWTRGRLATVAGVSKNSVYGFLDGTRHKITADNRGAIAEALKLEPGQLPD